jgi:hypothetical protein
MNWVIAITGVLVLWSSAAWGATLTWFANGEPDLAGYRVYHCSRQPCTKSSGNASLLVTLGKGTSFNIGTPAVTQYYFITAYDFGNRESNNSSVVTFPPPPITFDATSNSATGNTSNSISWNHTVGSGINRLLEVCTQARDAVAGDVPVLTVTANGRALTKVRRDIRTDGGSAYGTEIWHLVNPASGTNTITVRWAGPLSEYGVGSATSYAGVNQSAPIDAQSGGGGIGTTIAATITTVVNHALVTDCVIGQGNGLNIGAGQTTKVDRYTSPRVDVVGVSTVDDKTLAGPETMNWIQDAAQNWVISVVSLRPAP